MKPLKKIGNKVTFIFNMTGTIVGYNGVTPNQYVLDHLQEVPEQLIGTISFYDKDRYPYIVLRSDGYKDVYGDESFV